MPIALPSLSLLLATVESERARQLQHFEGLDSKAGLVLGFSGVLATLAANVPALFRIAGLAATIVAGAFALASFWPRGLPSLDVSRLRRYLTSDERFTQLTLHDTLLEMDREAAAVLASKSGRLRFALGSLAVAVLVFATGIAYDGVQGEADVGRDNTTEAEDASS